MLDESVSGRATPQIESRRTPFPGFLRQWALDEPLGRALVIVGPAQTGRIRSDLPTSFF